MIERFSTMGVFTEPASLRKSALAPMAVLVRRLCLTRRSYF
jgi:hypothetical protein